MKYRKLGNTGLEVSVIGFGAWGIGGATQGMPAYGPTEDEQSKSALRRAFDLGVNFFDTSGLYGHGHSERLIGEAFKDCRSDVLIATKAGLLDADGAQDFSPIHIRQSLEQSLRSLGTDYVDLYQLHSPPINLLKNDGSILVELENLQKAGKIRAFGISVSSPNDGQAAVEEFGFKSIQLNFNLVDQRARENGFFELCETSEVGVIVRTPLCFGFLTGAYSSNTAFGSGDHRENWSANQIDSWSGANQIFSKARMEESQQSYAQTALRFCLSYPCVSTAIPGMLNLDQVEENVAAGGLGPLPEEELLVVEQIYRDNEFFLGR